VFNWEHYPFAKIEAADRKETPLVPSIPMLFHAIILVLMQVEKQYRNQDFLAELDKKILKPVEQRSYDKKLLITDTKGNGFLITACRKEHVKLIYDGSNVGLLSTLKLCNRLIDVFSVGSGFRQLVGGGHFVTCSCGTLSANATTSTSAAPAAIGILWPTTVERSESPAQGKSDSKTESRGSSGAPSPADNDSHSPGPDVEMGDNIASTNSNQPGRLDTMQVKQEAGDDTYQSDDEERENEEDLNEDDGLLRNLTLKECWEHMEKYIHITKKSVEKCYKNKFRDQERETETLKEQLTQANQRIAELEQRIKQETELNNKLRDRVDVIQKKLEKSSVKK